MKNMVWHGQVEAVINDKQSPCADPINIDPDYRTGFIGIGTGMERCLVHIDELREIIQRYDARI